MSWTNELALVSMTSKALLVAVPVHAKGTC